MNETQRGWATAEPLPRTTKEHPITNTNPTTPRPGASRVVTETKAAFKTTEFWVFIVVSLAILIAAAVTDNGEDGQGFGAAQAWSYVALVAVGYMISRGLAKAGTKGREHHND